MCVVAAVSFLAYYPNLRPPSHQPTLTANRKQEGPVGDFPGGVVIKNPPANAGDTGSSPGPGRSHMPRSN